MSTTLLLLLLTAGCASPEVFHFSMAFRYPARGIGPSEHRGSFMLIPGQEDRMVTQAFISALQGMELNLEQRQLGLGQPFARGKTYKTDTAPLPDDLIAAYNAALGKSGLVLPLNRVYGIGYEVSYSIADEQLNFMIRPFLRHKSRGSFKWQEYGSEYSARFFGEVLEKRLAGALKTAASAQGS